MMALERHQSIDYMTKWDRFREKRIKFVDWYCKMIKKKRMVEFWFSN